MRKYMARVVCALLVLSLMLGGCGKKQTRYTKTYLDLFDTVTTVVGFGNSEAEFGEKAQAVYAQLRNYHQLFDIYHDYECMNNAKTINDQAGIAPVKVDDALIQLLLDCRDYYEMTDGKVNVAMGGVLKLWHDARSEGLEDPENAVLPSQADLQAAAAHSGFENIVIDENAGTVFITDPQTRLDLGAVAKGWAAQKVAESAPEGLLISVGGNVCATGPKPEGAWTIGIQNPDAPDTNLHTVTLSKGSIVTSGDYQRTYKVDGKDYHHIIDPQTLMPATGWRSVTVMCEDSGLADALSTALFILDLEQGKALAAQCGADALWVSANGEEFMTDGFAAVVQE